ncbi:MAG: amidohydrolase [Pirellulales bacterium]|nr:amidohydrolase [Pirellulales bacterium]
MCKGKKCQEARRTPRTIIMPPRGSSERKPAALGNLMQMMHAPRAATIVLPLLLAAAVHGAEPPRPATDAPLDGREGHPLALENFRPRSMLRLDNHPPQRARFPAVDVHFHPRLKMHSSPQGLDEYVRLMDEQNIALSVSLDGGTGESLAEHRKFLWTKYPDRFVIFSTLDFIGAGKNSEPETWDCHRPEFGRRAAELLADAKAQGASGLKFHKTFGLAWKNPDGSLIKIDDPRWDPIWEACGRLDLPVLIHTADPAAFWEPIDEQNERWEELKRHPEWSFHGPQWPPRLELLEALLRIVARHPQTKFIGAHVASNAEDLRTVGRWLDAYPNLYVDLAARIAELGRQPYTARDFFLKYSDRILFGTDGPRTRGRLLPHWELLETRDEFFAYGDEPFPVQGFWNIYGLDLPDEVLRQVYLENALRLIPGVRERYERWQAAPAKP